MDLWGSEDDNKVSEVEQISPADLEDDDLVDEMVRLIGEAADIVEQVKDHRLCPRGDRWEHRARTARRHKIRRFEVLRAEALSRGLADLPDIDPERERQRQADNVKLQNAIAGQKRHDAQIAELKAFKATHEVERARIHRQTVGLENERYKDRAGMFFAAAIEALSKDQRRVIWDRAREMFPDSPLWKNTEKADA